MTHDALIRMTSDEKRTVLRRLLTERAAAEQQRAERSTTDAFPLAHAQRALWFLQRLVPDTCAYNVAFAGRFAPSLDLSALRRAFDKLVERHAGLRTVFSEQDGQPVQRVLPVAEFRLCVVDACEFSEAELYSVIQAAYQTPFALDEPLAAATVFRRAAEDILLVNVHHLVFDAWSQQLLFGELRALYDGERHNRPAQLPRQTGEYRDFVTAQSTMLDGEHGRKLWSHWQSIFAAAPRPLNIRQALPRPPELSTRGATLSFALDSETSAGLHALAKRHTTTLYTVMLAAMQVLLFEFSGESDIVIGTPVSLRSRTEWLNVIGCFINMLPMRTAVHEDQPFSTHLGRARDTVLAALEHQEFPFSLLVDRLKLHRDSNRSPLFQAMLNVVASPRESELASLYTASRDALPFGDTALTSYLIPQQEGQFEIVIEMTEADRVLHGNLKYQSDLYTHETARAMTASFVSILEVIVRTPDIHIAELTRLDRDTFEL